MKRLIEAHHIELRSKSDTGSYYLYSPTREFTYSTDKENIRFELETSTFDPIQDITGIPFKDFKRKTSSASYGYNTTYTLHKLIDVEFHQKSEQTWELIKIIIHGKGCQLVPYTADRIISQANAAGFYLQRLDLKFDVSPDHVSFDTIDRHFKEISYTSPAACNRYISPSPENARTWYCGKLNRNGYRLSFYEAYKIHEELPAGVWRLELQSYGDAARQISKQLTDPEATMLALIANRITFRSISKTKNKSERPVPRWWSQLLQGAGSFRLIHSDTPPTLQKRQQKLLSDLYSRLISFGEHGFVLTFKEFMSQHLKGYSLVPAAG